MNAFKRKQKGFTIVELLIVIVIIGILAAITIVAYNGITARSRDAQRKSDLVNIAKALQLYNVDEGNYIEAGSGCGSGGNGNGWFNYATGSYPESINNCLKNKKYIQIDIVDPSKTVSCGITLDCRSYMKYSCGSGTFVYANLETVGHTSTDTDGTCNSSLDTNYGMNYFVKVN